MFKQRTRARTLLALAALGLTAASLGPVSTAVATQPKAPQALAQVYATSGLKQLVVKGRAPKTGYDRALFGDGWGKIGSCDTRNYILKRDLSKITWRSGETCTVATGVLRDPYTGKTINFVRGVSTSLKVLVLRV